VGCTSQEPEINAVCQRDAIGNYIIKWETTPEIDGELKVFVSDYPDMRNPAPAGNAVIRAGVLKYVTNDNMARKYFRLLFDDRYEQIVASRLVLMDSIPNFRDLGGYRTAAGDKTVKWGKVFRSGETGTLREWDLQRLRKMNIKTIIDLRTESEVAVSPVSFPDVRIVSVPVVSDVDHIIRQIMEGRVRKGDVSLFMQDMYLRFVNDTQPFEQALSVFLEEDNYPVLFISSRGKDRAGFLSALLLSALDVPEQTILSDYAGVNDYINLKRYNPLVRQKDMDVQEAMTVALSANEAFLNLTFLKIRKEHGSFDSYLREELHISEKQKEKLKSILLF
jgi:protein-tyrosine phosphatase